MGSAANGGGAMVLGKTGGAMVLGKLPVPGRPTILMTVGQGPIVLAVGSDGGWFRHFYSPLSPLSSFSLFLDLWEMAPYRLKYCLIEPLNQNNQPTNQNLLHIQMLPITRLNKLS